MKTRLMVTDNQTSADPANFSGVAQQQLCASLVKELGGTYASALGINLVSMELGEVFKWFLASVLFGARIGEGITVKTYKEFEKVGVLSPDTILENGWQGLVDILDRGGYVRYNFPTAMALSEVTWDLNKKYGGDLNRLHFFAKDERDLEKRLRGLGKGIRPSTVKLFLMELRGLWEKAEPSLAKPALLASRNLGLIQSTDAGVSLEQLKAIWEADEPHEWRFSDLEAALVRLGKNYCRRKRCSPCPVKTDCLNPK